MHMPVVDYGDDRLGSALSEGDVGCRSIMHSSQSPCSRCMTKSENACDGAPLFFLGVVRLSVSFGMSRTIFDSSEYTICKGRFSQPYKYQISHVNCFKYASRVETVALHDRASRVEMRSIQRSGNIGIEPRF